MELARDAYVDGTWVTGTKRFAVNDPFDSELVADFWQAVAVNGRMNLHVLLHYGRNTRWIAWVWSFRLTEPGRSCREAGIGLCYIFAMSKLGWTPPAQARLGQVSYCLA